MYSIPVIATDLRHEETIIQAGNALDCLQNTINDFFDKIDSRIDRNNTKLNEIRSRIDLAHKKINSLVGVNKAIKIFSPSRFPASHVLRDIPQTFNEFDNRTNKIIICSNDYEVQSNQEPVTQKFVQEKLQFFHVRTRNKSKLLNILEQKQGLGPIPRHLSSVNSLLLYSTSQNVYENYKTMDALLNYTKSDGVKVNEVNNKMTNQLEAPPTSMTNRLYNEKKINQGLFYTPKLNNAPEIDVPLDLPDLPGIADDIIFDISENDRIAPSMFIDNLPELPEPITVQDSISPDKKPTSNSSSSTGATVRILTPPPALFDNHPTSLTIPPPPPPPPLSTLTLTIPPPPPPPPPPSSLLISLPPPSALPILSNPRTDNFAIKPTLSENTSSGTENVHMNLMEAIRQAGGAKGGKLRAAADVVKEKNTGLKTTSTSGNLMADLHNRLSMRRKGISGTKEQESVSSANIESGANKTNMVSGIDLYKKISASLPPPELNPNSSSDASESDDDWAD